MEGDMGEEEQKGTQRDKATEHRRQRCVCEGEDADKV